MINNSLTLNKNIKINYTLLSYLGLAMVFLLLYHTPTAFLESSPSIVSRTQRDLILNLFDNINSSKTLETFIKDLHATLAEKRSPLIDACIVILRKTFLYENFILLQNACIIHMDNVLKDFYTIDGLIKCLEYYIQHLKSLPVTKVNLDKINTCLIYIKDLKALRS